MTRCLQSAKLWTIVGGLLISLLACSSPAPQAASGVGGQSGQLRAALTTFGSGALDPQSTNAATMRTIGGAMFDSLLGVTPEGTFGAGLAERWEISPDAKTWTFYLRKGVKFHDGSDMTAADVKFSIDRLLKPEATSLYAAVFRSVVDGVEQKDDSTVVLRLKEANPEWWVYLTPPWSTEGQIAPKKYIEEKGVDYFRSHPVGSGPWRFVKYDNNVELQAEAVDKHWRNTPQFKRLTVTQVAEESTRLAMLQSGQLDMIDITATKAAEAKAAGLRVIEIPRSSQALIPLLVDPKNPSAHPIGDLRVRKALSLAINRKEIADTVFGGYATPSVMPVVGGAYVDPNVKPDPYDPNESKRLLAEAGYPNGFSMKLYSLRMAPWAQSLAEVVGGYWDKVGVKAEIVPQDTATFQPLVQKGDPQVKGGAAVFSVTPVVFFRPNNMFHTKGFYSNISDPKLDAMIDKAAATTDPAERVKLGREAYVAGKDQYTLLGIVDISELFAVGKGIGEWKPIQGLSVPSLEYEKVPHGK